MRTGPFKFAWVDESESSFLPEHARYEEIIFSAVIEQTEANFATLTIEMKNPEGPGLLAAGRKRYCWLAWDSGTEVIPLFFGRVIGVPSSLTRAVIVVKFIAEPPDFVEQKHHVAQGLKARPGYDALLLEINKRDDPDAIIQGYPSLWHTDRVTHVVSASDVLVGEDGVEAFLPSEVIDGSVDVTYGDAPINSLSAEVSVTWANASSGFLDMGSGVRRTYTGASLISDWWKEGASLGGGWSVHHSYAYDLNNNEHVKVFNQKYKWENKEKTHAFGDTMSIETDSNGPAGFRPVNGAIDALAINLTHEAQIELLSENPDFKDVQPAFNKGTGLIVGIWAVAYNLVLRYDAGRNRVEKIRIQLQSDIQEIVTRASSGSAGGGGTAPIQIDGGDVGAPLITNDFITGETINIEGAPIVDPARTDYFTTERGAQTIEAAISRLRASLLLSSRAVEVDWAVTWERAINLSCRKNASLSCNDLPNGACTGKIISYTIEVHGDQASQGGKVRVGCAIGHAGHVTGQAGTPTYVDGYVDVGYQYMAGALVPLGTSDVAYAVPATATNDAGFTFPLTADQVVLVDEWVGSVDNQHVILVDKQATLVQTANTDQETFQSILQEYVSHNNAGTVLSDAVLNNGVARHITLRPVDQEGLEKTYVIETTVMTVPRMIDLE